MSKIERFEGDILSSNVFVVSEGDRCVLIDAGVPLKLLLPKLGSKKVEAIVLTHGHYDHIYYLQEYAKHFGCDVFGSKFIAEYLYDKNHNASEGSPYPAIELLPIEKLKTFDDAGKKKIGPIELEYLQLGGHSKADMLYKLGDNIFVGDIVIGRDVGRQDLWGGNKKQMVNSLHKLLDVEYQTMHCGHGHDLDKNTQNKVINLWAKFLSRNN